MDAKKFVWKNIVTRFGVPYTLFLDNDLQFDSKSFRRYCCDLRITNRYSTPAYLQGNGQAEAVNKVLVNGLKKRLDNAKGKWVEELSTSSGYIEPRLVGQPGKPFSMTFGVETVIPLEIGFLTLRTSTFNPSSNNELLESA